MKMLKRLTVLSLALFGNQLYAEDFDSGSTGVYGAINIISNTTLDTPAD